MRESTEGHWLSRLCWEIASRRSVLRAVKEKRLGVYHCGTEVRADIWIADLYAHGVAIECKWQDDTDNGSGGTAWEKLYGVPVKYEQFRGSIWCVYAGAELDTRAGGIKEAWSRSLNVGLLQRIQLLSVGTFERRIDTLAASMQQANDGQTLSLLG